MVRHIAGDFLKDERQYQQAERYWRELWDRLVEEAGVAAQWRTPWLGVPLRDGDPMFSAVSPALRRGVHVIQHGPTSEAMELEAWVDRFGEEGKDEVIDQLVISCALSEEAAARARQFMRAWVVSGRLPGSDKGRTGHTKPMADQSKNAGNIGDVIKHSLLPEVAQIFGKAFPNGWAYCETHAGFYDYPLYLLRRGDRWLEERAWSIGVLERTEKLLTLGLYGKVLDSCLKEGVYPGSLRLVNQALADDETLTALFGRDLGKDEVNSYVGKSYRIRVCRGDGYKISEDLPPLPRLMFVDPFWKEAGETKAVQEVLNQERSVIVWYPVTGKTEKYRDWQREQQLPYIEVEYATHRGNDAWCTRDQKGAGLTIKGLPPEAIRRGVEIAEALRSIFAGQHHFSPDTGKTRELSVVVRYSTGEKPS